MDARTNPYAPGAGTPPPELTGRDELIDRAAVALDRIRAGRAARSLILYGLRGVGKTVLLNKMKLEADAQGFATVWIEAPENRSLPAMLGPALRGALLRLDRIQAARDTAKRALRALAGFAKLKVSYGDIAFGLDLEPEPGLADSGDLDTDLGELIEAVGIAAQDRGTALVLFVDELQYVAENQLASLISALHGANQRQLPVTMVAAGLPQVLAQSGRAKSYAERLFEFVPVDRLDPKSASEAIVGPALREQVRYSDEALEEILSRSLGYPYFLQEWGKHCWNTATASPITGEDAVAATEVALAELDASFFRLRFDLLTPAEKRYMRAMAELGQGPHRSGDIAAVMKRQVTSVAPVRNGLIGKNLLYSPGHGDTAFTVPLFDGFMRRIMPVMD